MPKPKIGLPDKARAEIAAILNTLLADEFVLYTKTRNFHWNVVGPNFHSLHKFFEAQYDEIAVYIDDTAERVRTLGATPLGTMADFLKNTRLKEATGNMKTAEGMLTALLADHEQIIQSLREAVETVDDLDDEGTTDFLTGLMKDHEKAAWMIRSHIE